jgi:pimeloyl-ACP methyl ester carboxylesterase
VEDRPVSADEWFSGGERLPYDPVRAEFDDGSALRVFVRAASGAGTTLTFLPGWPDGSFGWAKVDAQFAERSDADRLFLDYVGHGDSDKPLEHPYSTYERADLVEAVWRARSIDATVVVAFDYSCIVSLELLARRIERKRAGEDPGTLIRACLLANGGLFADGHTHPWFTTPLFKSRAGGAFMSVGQRSRRAFAPFFRPVFSRSYRVTAAEVEQAYRAISRRDGSACCPPQPGSSTSTASTPRAGTSRVSPPSSRVECVCTSSAAARTDSRLGSCAWLGNGWVRWSIAPSSRVAIWPPRSSPGASPSWSRPFARAASVEA